MLCYIYIYIYFFQTFSRRIEVWLTFYTQTLFCACGDVHGDVHAWYVKLCFLIGL